MPQCKGCGQTTVWNKKHQEQTGKWIPHDPASGLPHDCPAYQKPDKYIDTKPQEREERAQQQTQGPSRYEGTYLIPNEDWQYVKATLERISTFQEGIMNDIEATRNLIYQLQSEKKHQQHLAEAEEQYDHDKESGFV